MPQNDLTEIIIVLDRSGSMSPLRDATIESVNGFMDAQKDAPGRASVTLVQFDHAYDVVFEGKDVRTAPRLTRETYVPRGSTALLGAMGRAIDEAGRRLAALPEAERPAKVVVVVVTDGEENNTPQTPWGAEYTRERVFAMVRHQEGAYAWQFVFLAANQDAIKTAGGLGIHESSSLNFDATPASVRRATKKMSDGMALYRSAPAQMTPGEYVVASKGFFGGSVHADDEVVPTGVDHKVQAPAVVS